MKKKRPTSLFAILIAASLVAKSIAGSAWAMPIHTLPDDPTEQRDVIEQLIREEFPEEFSGRMIAIANCESTGVLHTKSNRVVLNRLGTGAYGVFQIEMVVHRQELQKRNRTSQQDVFGNVRDYIKFARELFDRDRRAGRSGFNPWPTCAAITKLSYTVKVAEVFQNRDLR